MEPLTQSRLREVLSFDPDTQIFIWRQRRGSCSAGVIAGCKGKIRVDGRSYREEALKSLYETGSFPVKEIAQKKDKKVTAKKEKKPQKLRGMYSSNTSGYRGVTAYKNGWISMYNRGNVKRYLGYFDEASKAGEAFTNFEAEVAEAAHWAKHSIHCSIHDDLEGFEA